MAYKKGTDLDDQHMDRLNKTYNDSSKQTPRKTTRQSNLLSKFGSE